MRRYAVSKYFKITVFIALCGICLIVYAVIDNFRFRHSLELQEGDQLSHLRGNQYVRMEIERYLVTEEGWHVLAEELHLTKNYQIYTAEIGDGAYVQVGINDQKTIEALEAFSKGTGNKVQVFGRVSNKGVQHLDWYVLAEGFELEALHKKQCIYQVTAEEVKARNRLLMIYGFCGLAVSFFLFFSVAGVKAVYEKPFEDSERYKECVIRPIYNLEERLQREKQNMEELRREQGESWKWAASGAGIVLAGLLVIAVSCVLAIPIPLFILGIFPGLYMIWMSFSWFWHAFVNSDLESAKRISEVFMLRTTSIKMEETSKVIGALTRRLREKQQEEEKHRGEEGEIPMWYGPGVWERGNANSEEAQHRMTAETGTNGMDFIVEDHIV